MFENRFTIFSAKALEIIDFQPTRKRGRFSRIPRILASKRVTAFLRALAICGRHSDGTPYACRENWPGRAFEPQAAYQTCRADC